MKVILPVVLSWPTLKSFELYCKFDTSKLYYQGEKSTTIFAPFAAVINFKVRCIYELHAIF